MLYQIILKYIHALYIILVTFDNLTENKYSVTSVFGFGKLIKEFELFL